MGNVSHGPSIVTDGLVLCLDNYNEQSYLGEPTVNDRADISDWTLSADGSPSGGQGTVTFSSDGYLANVVNVNQNVKFSSSLYVTANGTYTHSMKFRLISGSLAWNTISFYMYTTGHGSHWVWASGADSMDLTNTTEWQTVEHTWTMTGGSTLMNFYIGAQAGVAYNNSFEIKDIQIEEKPHATKWVDGTRSATDGWQDLSGNNNHADLTQLAYSATNVPGTNVNDFSFDGTDDYASVSGIGCTSSHTVSMWINPAASTGGDNLKVLLDNANNYVFGFRNDKINHYTYQSDLVYSDTSISIGSWSHIVMSRTSSTAIFYLNGVADGSVSVGDRTIGSGTYTIGYRPSGSYPFYGSISGVQIYDKTMSATEVLRNYNANKGRYGL